MAFVKDLWHKNVVADDGSKARARSARYGRGKRWLAVWHEPGGEERTKAFAVKKDAELYAAAQEIDVVGGVYIDPKASKERFDAVGQRWLDSRGVDPASIIRYEQLYRLHVEPKFGRWPIRANKTSDVAT